MQEKILEIENATIHQKSRLAWQNINHITGRNQRSSGKLKATSPQDIIKKWKEHFENLLGQPPEVDDKEIQPIIPNLLPINCDDFTMEELGKCVNDCANNKATGLDNIPAEVWKCEGLKQPLLEVCNKVLHGDKPHIWGRSGILPFPKKGDLGYAANYRGISLTVIAAKIYNKMLVY